MTRISPLLKNQLEANKNHENVYRHLTEHANDVKPNLPKAKLVRENVLQSAASAVKDTFQDGKNFFKATKTGKMNDNNLGRINDLGMKAGALLIATFLASRAKTKTDAIMQFIGGTTFFASMALWPKLFINLPARLVHGFRIDHKYLSAQGDKKDLGLDNQFQPMDIFSDEEILNMAKKAGIDPKDEFAKEKMQRKLQKTMLQNRTLWMATAGFATPLMTSITGNFVEPLVRKGVIEHGYKKTKEIIGEEEKLVQYLAKSKAQVKNADAIEGLFKGMDTASLDGEFYGKLADAMGLNQVFEQFKDSDDIRPISSLKSENLIPVLMKIREDNSFIDKESLLNIVSDMKVIQKDGLESLMENAEQLPLGREEAAKLLEGLGDRISLTEVRRALASRFGESQIGETMKTMQADNSQFFKIIKNYNSTVLGSLKGRLKAYMDLLNPVVGSKSESKYTADFTETMRKIFKDLGITDKDYKLLQKGTLQEQQEFLSARVKAYVTKNPDYVSTFLGGKAEDVARYGAMTAAAETRYQALKELAYRFADEGDESALRTGLKSLFGEDFYLVKDEGAFKNFVEHFKKGNIVWLKEIMVQHMDSPQYQDSLRQGIFPRSEVEATIDSLITDGNLRKISEVEGDIEPLSRAICGGDSKLGIASFIKNFVKNKRIDLLATKYKPIIAANFEARLAAGEFENLTAQQIQALKNIVYDGTVSMRFNQAEIRNAAEYRELIKTLFNPGAYLKESSVIPGFSRVITALRDVLEQDGDKFNTAKYFRTGSFTDLVKNFGTRLNENKAWKKIFIPMAIALVGITLLAQPFFGKIDKEFPKKAKKEGVDNGNK